MSTMKPVGGSVVTERPEVREALKPTLRQVVNAWAEECLNTDNAPSLDKMHPITWAKTKLPALVEVLEKAGFRN